MTYTKFANVSMTSSV